MIDFISDRLTRLRNGSKVQLKQVHLHPETPKYCLNVLEVLCAEGYIRSFSETFDVKTKKRSVCVYIKYDATGVSAFSTIYRVSTPGRRIFVPIRALWRIQSGRGVFILSTTKGIRTDDSARNRNVGGEVLFGVY